MSIPSSRTVPDSRLLSSMVHGTQQEYIAAIAAPPPLLPPACGLRYLLSTVRHSSTTRTGVNKRKSGREAQQSVSSSLSPSLSPSSAPARGQRVLLLWRHRGTDSTSSMPHDMVGCHGEAGKEMICLWGRVGYGPWSGAGPLWQTLRELALPGLSTAS
jgi:hypothetical protein